MKFNVNTKQEAFDKAVAHVAVADRCDTLRDELNGRDAVGALVTCNKRGDKDSLVGRTQFVRGSITSNVQDWWSLIRNIRAITHDDANWDGNTFLGYEAFAALAEEFGLSRRVLLAVRRGRAERRSVRSTMG